MASDNLQLIGAQNTGNPVLDTAVNLMVGLQWRSGGLDDFKAIHAVILELAAKEPGGLRRNEPTRPSETGNRP